MTHQGNYIDELLPSEEAQRAGQGFRLHLAAAQRFAAQLDDGGFFFAEADHGQAVLDDVNDSLLAEILHSADSRPG